MIETSLFKTLSTLLPGARIYPVLLPEDSTLPAITYQIISNKSTPGMTTSGIQRARVQIDCWADTYGDAATLRAAVISALNGYSSTDFQAQLSQIMDNFEHESLHYRACVEFFVWFSL